MAVEKVGSSLRETGKQSAEIVTTSRDAVIAVTRLRRWVPPLVKQVTNQTKQLQAQGHNLTLSPITVDAETEGMRIADTVAKTSSTITTATRALSIAFLRATMRKSEREAINQAEQAHRRRE